MPSARRRPLQSYKSAARVRDVVRSITRANMHAAALRKREYQPHTIPSGTAYTRKAKHKHSGDK